MISRRIFLQSSTAVALTGEAARAADAAPTDRTGHGTAGPVSDATRRYGFFMPKEQAFIEAALVRLIPPDALGPSALEAGVPHYLDLQLGGAWGAGERLYRSGPWAQGKPTQGYQLPFTPAELFRTALRAIDADVSHRHGKAFEQLPGTTQDAYLTDLQTGTLDLGGVPSKVFFETLWAMTLEGYFGDPAYGGNLGMASWRMIGFPGAYGAYYDLVDRHGIAFQGEPRSLAQNGQGHVHVDPTIPAGLSREPSPAQSHGRPLITKG